jgi:hypothetical protein
MGLICGVRTSAASFLASMCVAVETGGVAAAALVGRRRMCVRLFLGGMPTAALAGRQAFVEIDLLRHLLSPFGFYRSVGDVDLLRWRSTAPAEVQFGFRGMPLTRTIARGA